MVIEDAWATDPGGDLAYTIAGLTPGEDYDVQARAVNSVGAGDWSATAAAAAGRFTLVPYDWGLRPDSVAGGQSFRLLFVTSQGRWATFTDLASYDRRVQERAAEGHSDIRAYSAQFKVLGSSETIAARDNTRTNPNTRGAGEPVYWLDGPRVADDYADFYDGWDNSNPARNETGASFTFRPYVFGNVTPEVFVWTGTKRDGSSHEGHYLGSAEPILGMPADGESALGSIYSNIAAALFRLYGLSGVFRLADPPPTTATLTALTVSPGEIEGFAPDSTDSTEYDVGVASTVAQVTITAVPSSSQATLAYDPADDADPNADGHQVDFTPGANTVTVTLTVTAQDSTTTGTYTVNFVRPVVVPGAPTIDTVTPGDGTLTVAWSAPTETGDTDITAYGVRHILTSADDKADANWVVIEDAWATDPGGDLAYTIAGLTPGEDYDVQVRAVNSVGAGDWSATAAAAAGRFTLVPYDWGLRPDSVAGGQSFRLLFVTSQGRWATSGDLASYDRRVQERAAEGHSDIRAYSAQFKVLGSNGRIAARDNTRTNPNAHGAGEPVYWLDGPRVADDYADFYDGWDNSNPARNETGASITFRPYESGRASRDQAVWTGTNRDGSIDEGHYLGSSEPIFGMPADGGSALGSTYSHVATTLFPLYGLSGVFRLADPPPTTATLTVLTVSPGDIEGFAPDSTDSTEYDVGVASTVAQVTITAVPSSSQATLAYDPADDADPNADGHQVDFTPGANTVTVTLTVTAQDGNTTGTYTVNVIRETKPVTVSFGEADYDVAEGGEVEVTVSLNEAPGREVEIPITATGQDGASEADYSPSATTVTFASSETEQRFTFTATDDTVDDDGESVTLSFGTLPDRGDGGQRRPRPRSASPTTTCPTSRSASARPTTAPPRAAR